MTTPDHAAALALLARITPGPWAARLNSSKSAYYIKGGDGIHIGGLSWHADARRFYTLQDESCTNARAIAALPELAAVYRAGVELRRFHLEDAPENMPTYDAARLESERLAALDAALAAVAEKLTKGD
jgi:hypothetical protein